MVPFLISQDPVTQVAERSNIPLHYTCMMTAVFFLFLLYYTFYYNFLEAHELTVEFHFHYFQLQLIIDNSNLLHMVIIIQTQNFTDLHMERLYMETQVGLNTTALSLFAFSDFFSISSLQLLCMMISHWLTVLKHKMPRQMLLLKAGLVW